MPSSELPYLKMPPLPRAHVCILTSGSKFSFAARSHKVIISLLCTGSFVPGSFGSFGLSCVSFSLRARAFGPSRCLALNPAMCWGARAILEAAAINSSVPHCFSTFGCALWQPSLSASTPEF